MVSPHHKLFPCDEPRLRSPGAAMTAKRTYTDTAMGVARQSDWITGCELSCFGVRRCVWGCTTFSVFAQFPSASHTADKPKTATSGSTGARHAEYRNQRKYQRAADARRSFHTLTVSCVVYSLMRGESCGHVFLEVHGFTDTTCNIVTAVLMSLSSLSGLWSVCIFFLRLIVKPPVRHIVRCETRGKVVREL